MLPRPENGTHDYRLYIGPMEFFRISSYDLGLYGMVDYGWDSFEWVTRPFAQFIFIPVFEFLGNIFGNFGIVIIVFAVLMKIVLYPLTKSSYESMARMRELQPKMEAIKEKYADDPQKQQEAIIRMYKETGINPLGGCLPMLAQYPVLIALWQFFPSALEIRQQSFLWADDLSAPDVILNLPFTIPLYGDFVAGFTLLMGLSLVVQMRLQSQPATNPQAKVFTYVMPIMLFLFFNRLASGLSLYYLVYNVLTAIQQKFINERMEKKHGAEATNGKSTRKEDALKAQRREKSGQRSKGART
jgi:YidC/Oxa1 family membrane protein insertase